MALPMEACVMMLLETGMKEEVRSCGREVLQGTGGGGVDRPLELRRRKNEKSPPGPHTRLRGFLHQPCWVWTKQKKKSLVPTF